MSASLEIDLGVRCLTGGLMVCIGLYLTRPKHNRRRAIDRLARKFHMSVTEIEALFRPLATPAFDMFGRGIAVSIAAAGLGMALGSLLTTRYVAILLLALGIGGAMLGVGLQITFTARASVYARRLYWVDLRTWRPDWLTAVEIVWYRLFGLLFLAIGGLVALVAAELALETAGILHELWLP